MITLIFLILTHNVEPELPSLVFYTLGFIILCVDLHMIYDVYTNTRKNNHKKVDINNDVV